MKTLPDRVASSKMKTTRDRSNAIVQRRRSDKVASVGGGVCCRCCRGCRSCSWWLSVASGCRSKKWKNTSSNVARQTKDNHNNIRYHNRLPSQEIDGYTGAGQPLALFPFLSLSLSLPHYSLLYSTTQHLPFSTYPVHRVTGQ